MKSSVTFVQVGGENQEKSLNSLQINRNYKKKCDFNLSLCKRTMYFVITNTNSRPQDLVSRPSFNIFVIPNIFF